MLSSWLNSLAELLIRESLSSAISAGAGLLGMLQQAWTDIKDADFAVNRAASSVDGWDYCSCSCSCNCSTSYSARGCSPPPTRRSKLPVDIEVIIPITQRQTHIIDSSSRRRIPDAITHTKKTSRPPLIDRKIRMRRISPKMSRHITTPKRRHPLFLRREDLGSRIARVD